MAALGRKGPTRIRRAKTEAPMVGDGEDEGGLKSDPGGAPVSTAPFLELASESAAISWAEIDSAKVLGRRRS